MGKIKYLKWEIDDHDDVKVPFYSTVFKQSKLIDFDGRSVPYLRVTSKKVR